MLISRRGAFAAATLLTVAGLTTGCRLDRPVADAPAPPAVTDGSAGRQTDPFADLDPVLDDAERDVDAATAEG